MIVYVLLDELELSSEARIIKSFLNSFQHKLRYNRTILTFKIKCFNKVYILLQTQKK